MYRLHSTAIDNLPAEIQYHFTELSVKEKELADAHGRIQRRQARLFASSASEDSNPSYGKLIDKIRADFRTIQKLIDEKNVLVDKAFKLLDRHVVRLDTDLKRHWAGHEWDVPTPQTPPLGPVAYPGAPSLVHLSRNSMGRTGSLPGSDRVLGSDMKIHLPVLPSPHSATERRRKNGGPRLKIRLTPGSSASLSPPPSSFSRRRKARNDDDDDADEDAEGEEDDTSAPPARRGRAPARHNTRNEEPSGNNGDEEIYCFCRSVSFGEMIGCDNDNCPLEWFHLACVGLSKPPEGEWYCSPDCRAEGKKG